LRLQRYYFFHIRQKIFLFFFTSYPQIVDFLKSKSRIFFSPTLSTFRRGLFFGPEKGLFFGKLTPRRVVTTAFRCKILLDRYLSQKRDLFARLRELYLIEQGTRGGALLGVTRIA
jgi:hypothetical protein